jgi:hypothetical protein
LNSSVSDYSLEKISKTIYVSQSNALLQYAFATVFSAAHPCCSGCSFFVRVFNAANGASLTCLRDTVFTPSPQCTIQPTGFNFILGGAFSYNKWHIRALDLSPYISQSITVEFTASDCNSGGHYLYCYFDAQCGFAQTIINGNQLAPIGGSLNVNSCYPTATLSAPAGIGNCQWTGPSGFTSSLATLTSSVPGTYVLTLGQNSCGGLTSTINLSFSSSSLAISSSNGSVVCPGQSITLNASGGFTSYMWSNGSATPSISVAIQGPTVYTLTATNGLGCIRTSTYGLLIYPQPTISLSGNPSTVCAGSNATLVAIGAQSYTWNTGVASPSIQVAPLVNTVYTVAATDANGCKTSKTYTQNVLPVANLSISAPAGTICAGTSITLTASGALLYLWSQGDNTNTVVVTPMASMVYSLIGTSANGCTTQATYLQEVDACAGIKARYGEKSRYTIAPNPNKGEFTLHLDLVNGKCEVRIFDGVGKQIHAQKINSGDNKIHLGIKPAGFYTYVLVSDGQPFGKGRLQLE